MPRAITRGVRIPAGCNVRDRMSVILFVSHLGYLGGPPGDTNLNGPLLGQAAWALSRRLPATNLGTPRIWSGRRIDRWLRRGLRQVRWKEWKTTAAKRHNPTDTQYLRCSLTAASMKMGTWVWPHFRSAVMSEAITL